MNIFATHRTPIVCADDHCYIHTNKMIVEYAQLMSSAHHEWGTWKSSMYKPTHMNHPSTKWTYIREGNYEWLYQVWSFLLLNYTMNTGKEHASSRLSNVLNINAYEEPKFTYQMLAMPFKFKGFDVFRSYQNYLNSKFAEWQSRDKPLRVKFRRVPDWYVAA